MKILTFDIEEWFHILDNTSTQSETSWAKFETRIHANMNRILQMLSDRQKKATFFCLGWIAEKYPEVIKQIHAEGHEIGSHSYLHQLVYQQSPEEFRCDLHRSIETLQNLTGSKITLYRSPGFSITSDSFWAFDALMEMGVECDCSIFPAHRNHGGVADFPLKDPFMLKVNGGYLKELPMSVYQIGRFKIPFSGGGYFRLFPYSAIKYMSNRSRYLMTYFHPRDFDKDQPIIENLSLIRRFKSYYGLENAHHKFEKFIVDQDFISVGEAIDKINWAKAPVYDIKYSTVRGE